jgi:hypothetical protein
MKVELYYNLSFKFDYKVLSRKENKIHFSEVEILDESGTAPCPRDADIKNGSYRKGERDTPAKQHKGKD